MPPPWEGLPILLLLLPGIVTSLLLLMIIYCCVHCKCKHCKPCRKAAKGSDKKADSPALEGGRRRRRSSSPERPQPLSLLPVPPLMPHEPSPTTGSARVKQHRHTPPTTSGLAPSPPLLAPSPPLLPSKDPSYASSSPPRRKPAALLPPEAGLRGGNMLMYEKEQQRQRREREARMDPRRQEALALARDLNNLELMLSRKDDARRASEIKLLEC